MAGVCAFMAAYAGRTFYKVYALTYVCDPFCVRCDIFRPFYSSLQLEADCLIISFSSASLACHPALTMGGGAARLPLLIDTQTASNNKLLLTASSSVRPLLKRLNA